MFLDFFVCVTMVCGYGGWKKIKAKKTISIPIRYTEFLVVGRL